MSWMITDKSEISGTCYIEFLPGEYQNKCWNPESVYFQEESFGFIEPIIVRHCPEYDHYAFTDISRAPWEFIISDLQRIANQINDATRLADIEEEIGILCVGTKNRFLKSEAKNIFNLREMLLDFIKWLRQTLVSHNTIAVLGI